MVIKLGYIHNFYLYFLLLDANPSTRDKKLEVDATQYILDKLTQKNQMTPHADLIFQKANAAV